MPSSHVTLPAPLIRQLRQAVFDGTLDSAFRTEHLRLDRLSDVFIRVSVDTHVHAPELAPLYSKFRHGVSLSPAQSRPVRGKELPDDVVHHLLDLTSDILLKNTLLTGHERMQLIEAFDLAKHAGRAPLACPPQAGPHPCLRCSALPFVNALEPEISALDRQMSAYRAATAGTYLQGAIATLSFQSELANALLVGKARASDGALKAALLSSPNPIRIERCHAAMEAVSVFMSLAKDIDPFNSDKLWDVSWETLREAHRKILGWHLASDESGHPRRTEMLIRSARSTRAATPAMAPELIPQAMDVWDIDTRLSRWSGIPWIIRAGLSHVAFEKIHPFVNGNGRIGRLGMLLQMIEQKQPAVPLEAALRKRRGAYLSAIEDAIASNDNEPFLRFLMIACGDAVDIGLRMLAALQPLHQMLTDAIGATKYPIPYVPDVASRMLGRLLIQKHNLDFLDSPELDDLIRQLEAKGLLQPIVIAGRYYWVIPGVADLLRQVTE